MKNEAIWLLCPICRNKTRLKVRTDTELINFPLYCPKCKQETLVNVKKSKLSVIRMADLISKEDNEL
ncbi:MAG TPA: conjugal transfer protein [Ruminococcaceae bacterium]|nr:conjugal transfer protein [Oscillospiraceae bacterium]